MNYVNFMRKIEGKEPQHDITDSTTSGPRPLDLLGIIEFARGLGYSHGNLETRPEVPTDNRADVFWAGYDGNLSFSAAMGMYGRGASCFYWAGREYQRQQGNTHSQQQDSVPVEAPRGNGGSGWAVTGDDGVNLDELRTIIRRLELFSMGSPPPSPQPREEPEGGVYRGGWEPTYCWVDEQPLRPTLSAEESGVQGVCDERESGECSPEDTWEPNRRSVERGEGW
jgi:hypothetical protein